VTTVDRQRWIEERLRFLGGLLADAETDDRRSKIEAEMAALQKEAGVSNRWLRRLLGVPRWPTGR
jgi:hypothetical protein